jgi:SRSO17 transposase
VVTTHLYDGKKSLPLDIELYQHGNSLPEGKKDREFKKKPTLALELIDKSLKRGYRPGIVLTGLRQKTIRKQPQTQVAQGIYTKH